MLATTSAATPAVVCWVPMLAEDVHDTRALHEIRALLFGPDTHRG